MLLDQGNPIDQMSPREIRKYERETIRNKRRQFGTTTRFGKFRRRIYEWVNADETTPERRSRIASSSSGN